MVPSSSRPDACPRCHGTHDLSALPPAYVHLLGLYLGDGYLAPHPREVFKLRLVLDRRYPQLIVGAIDSVRAVCGRAALLARADNCVEVYAFSRSWICLLPQHGPGKKHDRPIILADWQL